MICIEGTPSPRSTRSNSTDVPPIVSDVASSERLLVLGQLSAAVSHELAQPLLAALNYLSVAADRCLQDPQLDPVLHDSVAGARAQVDRAVQIARHIRRIAVQGVASREVFDLPDLLRECLRQFEEEEPSTAHVQLDAHPESLPVHADRVLVQQVVMNLLRNASEAMDSLSPSERIIQLTSCVHDANHARVAICDHGPGLPKDRALMSKPFLTSKQGGFGLGLWLSRLMIESNDGRFWAEDRPCGGAALSFTLLLADGANQWKS